MRSTIARSLSSASSTGPPMVYSCQRSLSKTEQSLSPGQAWRQDVVIDELTKALCPDQDKPAAPVGQESDGRISRWLRSSTKFNLVDVDAKSGAGLLAGKARSRAIRKGL